MSRPDPVAGLRLAFERIAVTRMAGVPVQNPALRVAVIGFRPWDDGADGVDVIELGILLTPWAMNLVAVARNPECLRLATDVRRTWRFPSGAYELMGGEEPECGCFQFCSLFSPVFEFADQAAAEATAQAVIAALFVGNDGSASSHEQARVSGNSLLHAPTSRRGFLRGMLGGRVMQQA